jgi:hypothetical protein
VSSLPLKHSEGNSRNNQHNAQNLYRTTALFYLLAPTCFGSSLPSSGSFWVRLSYVRIQIDTVVYLKYITALPFTIAFSILLVCHLEHMLYIIHVYHILTRYTSCCYYAILTLVRPGVITSFDLFLLYTRCFTH